MEIFKGRVHDSARKTELHAPRLADLQVAMASFRKMCEDKSVSVRPSAHPLRSFHPLREFDAAHIASLALCTKYTGDICAKLSRYLARTAAVQRRRVILWCDALHRSAMRQPTSSWRGVRRWISLRTSRARTTLLCTAFLGSSSVPFRRTRRASRHLHGVPMVECSHRATRMGE